jgi:plasmid stability protein
LREVAVDRQNITLALPKDVLKRLKIMAAERGSSMSAMMEELLQDHLARHEGYAEARRRQSTLLARGLDMGTRGKASWNREQLHER